MTTNNIDINVNVTPAQTGIVVNGVEIQAGRPLTEIAIEAAAREGYNNFRVVFNGEEIFNQNDAAAITPQAGDTVQVQPYDKAGRI